MNYPQPSENPPIQRIADALERAYHLAEAVRELHRYGCSLYVDTTAIASIVASEIKQARNLLDSVRCSLPRAEGGIQ